MNDDDIEAVMEILWESSEAKAQEVLNYTKKRAERLAALVAPLISEARNDALESRPMTADREAILNAITEADARTDEQRTSREYIYGPLADAVVGVLRPVADVQAEAWDEGFDAGEADVMNHNKAGWDGDCIPNPYRTPASPKEGNDQ